jgi:hypothetical protein
MVKFTMLASMLLLYMFFTDDIVLYQSLSSLEIPYSVVDLFGFEEEVARFDALRGVTVTPPTFALANEFDMVAVVMELLTVKFPHISWLIQSPQ